MKNYSLLVIAVFFFFIGNILSVAIAMQTSANSRTKTSTPPPTKDIPPIQRPKQGIERIPHISYFYAQPTECELIEMEDAIIQHYEHKVDYKITEHQIIPIDRKMTDQSIYYYGYYEISGFKNGKKMQPQRKMYLISCKHSRDNTWKVDIELWDYQLTQNPRRQEVYFF